MLNRAMQLARCVAVCLLLASTTYAHEPVLTIEHSDAAFQTRVRVAAHNGRFYWSDVLRGVARAKGFEDQELAGVLPTGSVKASGVTTRAAVLGLDRATRPQVRFAIVASDAATGNELEITLDRAAILSSRRRFKKSVRELLTPERSHDEFGIHMPKRWKKLPRDSSLVLVAHGWNSNGGRLDPLCDVLQEAGHQTVHFDYPNDQSIADSAHRLSDELKRIAKNRPDLRFSVVAHSMGGLVVREVIENSEMDPGNIGQLVMVATPNHGSQLARIAFAFDLWQYAADVGDRGPLRSFFATIEDGLAEASRDLRPDSIFLAKLNRRDRNAKVRYSLILGDKGLLSAKKWDAARSSVASATSRHRFSRVFGPKLNDMLADMDEFVHDRGDGAVSVNRGRLAGVEDTVVLPFVHTDLADNPARAESSGLFKAIGERLK